MLQQAMMVKYTNTCPKTATIDETIFAEPHTKRAKRLGLETVIFLPRQGFAFLPKSTHFFPAFVSLSSFQHHRLSVSIKKLSIIVAKVSSLRAKSEHNRRFLMISTYTH
jgi:hypothetical protein